MTSWVNITKTLGKSISRGMSPRNTAMFQIPLDFTVDLQLKVQADMSATTQNKFGISGIQSVKIDNSLNSDVLILLFDNGENITCPPYCQAIFPVLFSGDTLAFTAISTVAVVCQLTFVNTREQAQVWTAKLPLAGTVNVTGSTVFTQKSSGTFTEFSQTITTGGTAQLLMAANANRKMIAIRNPATAASQNIAAPEPLYIGFGNAFSAMTVNAMGSWELLPGEQLPQFDLITTEAVYVVAATSLHRITAKTM
jgi:hypothetical protein